MNSCKEKQIKKKLRDFKKLKMKQSRKKLETLRPLLRLLNLN
jgi:hypothetical protein